MYRYLISTFLISIIYFHVAGQSIQHDRYNGDTSTINAYIKKALVFAQNPATIDSAEYYLTQFYSLSRLVNYDKGIIEYFRIKAVSFFIQQKEDSLSFYLDKAFSEAKRLHNKKELALVTDLKAWMYQSKEEYDSATTYYIKALKVADTIHDNKFSGEISNNLSILFWSIGDFNKAAEYASNAYRNGLKLQDTFLISNGLFNLGNAKTSLHEYDTAMALYNHVEQLIKDPASYNYVLFRTLGNEASILTETNRYHESIDKYKKILKLSAAVDPSLLSYIYSGLGAAQLQINLLDDAERNVAKAIQIGKNARQKTGLRDSYLLMANIKKAKNKFDSALFYREKYELLNDTINSEATNKNMHLLETKYNTAKKDNQIAQQELAIVQNKNIIQEKNILNIALVSAIAVLLIFGFLLYRNVANRQRILQQSEELKKQRILELETEKQLMAVQSVLKGQEEERTRLARDLHDGVGGLLSGIKLSMSTMKGNVFLSEEYAQTFGNVINQLDHTIAELRRVSHNMMPEALIKFGLKEALENYCENINVSGQLRLRLQTYGTETRMEQGTEIIVYRMIQELLTNIIKHAEATQVLIQLVREGERFNLTVEDNGKGFDPHEDKRGAGLANIKVRAEYLNGNVDIISKKGEATSIHIEGSCS